jgi:hypothetical protein
MNMTGVTMTDGFASWEATVISTHGLLENLGLLLNYLDSLSVALLPTVGVAGPCLAAASVSKSDSAFRHTNQPGTTTKEIRRKVAGF